MQITQRLPQYLYLMRLDKPIGTLLLLWPTLWALWLASLGHPDVKILGVFVAGVFLMRSAGCVINDFADRNFDPHVKRTANRPLAKGTVNPWEAILLAGLLAACAFLLVLLCNPFTISLSFIGAALAILYPFLKRVTNLPQLGLGLAFTWGVPMAFAAETNHIDISVWFLFLTGTVWCVIYDTIYAMVDRDDDIKIGVKSTAVLFSAMDKLIVGLLQLLFIVMMVIVGLMFHLRPIYFAAIVMVSVLFIYQQWLIRDRDSQLCFKAFLNNNWVGLIIFLGILLNYI